MVAGQSVCRESVAGFSVCDFSDKKTGSRLHQKTIVLKMTQQTVGVWLETGRLSYEQLIEKR